MTRTADELSIIAEDHLVPAELDCQRGWRGLGVEGPLDFNAVGIMAGLSQALASAGISLLAIATHDTDYILVRETDLAQALAALDQANYLVQPEGTAP